MGALLEGTEETNILYIKHNSQGSIKEEFWESEADQIVLVRKYFVIKVDYEQSQETENACLKVTKISRRSGTTTANQE